MIEAVAERVRACRSLGLVVRDDAANFVAVEVDRDVPDVQFEVGEFGFDLLDRGIEDLRRLGLALGELAMADSQVGVRLIELGDLGGEDRGDEIVRRLRVEGESPAEVSPGRLPCRGGAEGLVCRRDGRYGRRSLRPVAR